MTVVEQIQRIIHRFGRNELDEAGARSELAFLHDPNALRRLGL